MTYNQKPYDALVQRLFCDVLFMNGGCNYYHISYLHGAV